MLWDLGTGKIVQTLETQSPVTISEVSQDGRYITTADGSTVKFWDANHFGLVKSYYMPCNVESASLKPNHGNKFIAGDEDMWVHVFDFHTGEKIVATRVTMHGPVHPVCFSLGGESYAPGFEDGTIRIWQAGSRNHEWNDSEHPNGLSGRVKVEVTGKIESGLHISREGERDKATNA
ncbi:serine-threonine kinase receptor-associated protein-like [Herrania umbratica]|uniref:Serine-threonine kinase receptor-associated protein n=1 Tax=Herrania umbratica TaxID=108875 RepID=A0A6J1BH55_9ROSI|nr:serine-threonine kinase receptor-associated protein-like [Herrania umbratica]